MNLININQTIPSVAWPTNEEIQAVINKTHELGGLVSINHIPWSYYALSDQPTIDELISWGIDFVEVINQGTFDYQDYIIAMNYSVGIITGTDMHHPGEVYGWTAMKPENFTEEAIFQALKEKATSLLYSAISSPYSSPPIGTPANLILDPYFRLGAALKGYYDWHESMWSFNDSYCGKNTLTIFWKYIAICIGWLVAIFLLFEIGSQLIHFLWDKYACKGSCCRNKSKDYYDLDERASLMGKDRMTD